MTTLVFESPLRATAQQAYAWHARPGAFKTLTPWWAMTRVLREAPSLDPGSQALIRVGPGPLGVLWLAEHTHNDPPRGFVERQVRGPFRSWEHRHRFLPLSGEPDGSILRDELRYELPGGPLGLVADVLLVRPFLRRLFAYRHRATREGVQRRPATTHPVVAASAGASSLDGARSVAIEDGF